jgi:phage FluMu protein Com
MQFMTETRPPAITGAAHYTGAITMSSKTAKKALNQKKYGIMQELRCANCNKLLAKINQGEIEIKCNRCKTINHTRVISPNSSEP